MEASRKVPTNQAANLAAFFFPSFSGRGFFLSEE